MRGAAVGREGPERTRWGLSTAPHHTHTPSPQTHPPAPVYTLVLGQDLTRCMETPTPHSHSQPHPQHENPLSTLAALPTQVHRTYPEAHTTQTHTTHAYTLSSSTPSLGLSGSSSGDTGAEALRQSPQPVCVGKARQLQSLPCVNGKFRAQGPGAQKGPKKKR